MELKYLNFPFVHDANGLFCPAQEFGSTFSVYSQVLFLLHFGAFWRIIACIYIPVSILDLSSVENFQELQNISSSVHSLSIILPFKCV